VVLLMHAQPSALGSLGLAWEGGQLWTWQIQPDKSRQPLHSKASLHRTCDGDGEVLLMDAHKKRPRIDVDVSTLR
jgi:hypothetical protein